MNRIDSHESRLLGVVTETIVYQLRKHAGMPAIFGDQNPGTPQRTAMPVGSLLVFSHFPGRDETGPQRFDSVTVYVKRKTSDVTGGVFGKMMMKNWEQVATVKIPTPDWMDSEKMRLVGYEIIKQIESAPVAAN